MIYNNVKQQSYVYYITVRASIQHYKLLVAVENPYNSKPDSFESYILGAKNTVADSICMSQLCFIYVRLI
jgi:hypothetical protein